MKRPHTLYRFAGLALALPLLASCTTLKGAGPDEAVPSAPSIGFEMETPSPAPTLPAATPRQESLQPAPPAPQAAAPPSRPMQTKLRDRPRYVNVRPEPSADGKPVAVLMGGKRVEVVEEQGGWLKIRWHRGKMELEGWVVRRYVEGYDVNP